jgi:hypothetical protein
MKMTMMSTIGGAVSKKQVKQERFGEEEAWARGATGTRSQEQTERIRSLTQHVLDADDDDAGGDEKQSVGAVAE